MPEPSPKATLFPALRGAFALRLFLVLFSCILVSAAVAPAPAQAATRQELLNKGLEGFKWVKASEKRANRRDLWLKVHDRFDTLLKASTDTSYAPKALYYMGRCYEELATRSGLRSDAVRAADYFQRAANRFRAGHSWIDDCLYRKAELTFVRLGDGRAAAEGLREILRRYPGSDHADEARELLDRITGKRAVAAATARTEAAPAQPETRHAPANVKAEYDAARAELRALRRAKSPTRDAFLRTGERFRSVFHAVPRTTMGARAAYFVGFTYDELGQHSGREADFQRSVEYYERAADLFDRKDSWRDDAIYRKAVVEYERLSDEDQAYADLLLLTAEYPDGDMADDARALLAEMDTARAEALPEPEGPAMPTPAAPETRGAVGFSQATGPGMLTGVRYHSGDDFTRIVLDLTAPVEFSHAKLPADPSHGKTHRMYLDLDKSTVADSVDRKVDITDGFLRSIRTGQYDPDTARVVLDFESEQSYHVLTLQNPYRVVVDVFSSKTVAEENRPGGGADATAAKSTPWPKEPEDRKPGKKETQTAQDVLAQLGMTIGTVMIDAGHGGRDPGALQYIRVKDSKGRLRKKIRTMEKDVTLRMARILGETLKRRGYNVLYTRTADKKVQLEDRALAANIKKADLFISLHCNANNSSKVRGFETYYLGRARNDIVLKLAAKENNVDPVKISDTQKIVMDLVHSFKIKESKSLAGHVQKNSVSRLRRKFKGINDHGARSAPFFVLIGAKMPAVLVEIGYITNSTEAKLLRSESYLQTVADGIVSGIEAYKTELQTAGL